MKPISRHSVGVLSLVLLCNHSFNSLSKVQLLGFEWKKKNNKTSFVFIEDETQFQHKHHHLWCWSGSGKSESLQLLNYTVIRCRYADKQMPARQHQLTEQKLNITFRVWFSIFLLYFSDYRTDSDAYATKCEVITDNRSNAIKGENEMKKKIDCSLHTHCTQHTETNEKNRPIARKRNTIWLLVNSKSNWLKSK